MNPLNPVMKHFRASLCLNNLACALLERNCFYQASAVFQTAISTIQSTSNKRSIEVDIESSLQDAYRAFASPRPTPNASIIVTQSLQTGVEWVNSSLTLSFCPIRIDDAECNLSCQSARQDREFETACICHNYALCLLSLCLLPSISVSNLELVGQAEKLLHLALSMFDSHIARHHKNNSNWHKPIRLSIIQSLVYAIEKRRQTNIAATAIGEEGNIIAHCDRVGRSLAINADNEKSNASAAVASERHKKHLASEARDHRMLKFLAEECSMIEESISFQRNLVFPPAAGAA